MVILNTRTRVCLGVGLFLLYALGRVPDLRHGAWGEALLLFAALVMVPLLLDLVDDRDDDAVTARILGAAKRMQFGAAVCLGVAYGLSAGFWAALTAAPWAGELLLLATVGVRRMARRGFPPMAWACRDVGLIYAAVGALWLMLDRLALRPLEFDSAIVLLTAVHFHYAGLLLPLLTGLALEALAPARRLGVIGVGVIAGVPAVALGITASQLRWDARIEVAATLLMALGGFGAALLHLRLAAQVRWPRSARIFWAGAGLSLGGGMVLAALYGVRYFFHPFPWLDLPWMRALHGSLNAFGFGLCGVWGWTLARRNRV